MYYKTNRLNQNGEHVELSEQISQIREIVYHQTTEFPGPVEHLGRCLHPRANITGIEHTRCHSQCLQFLLAFGSRPSTLPEVSKVGHTSLWQLIIYCTVSVRNTAKPTILLKGMRAFLLESTGSQRSTAYHLKLLIFSGPIQSLIGRR